VSPLPNAERGRTSGPVANAFGHTFFWAVLMALVTIVPAAVLVHAERTCRRQQTAIGPETTKSQPNAPRRPRRVMYGPSAANRLGGHDIPSPVVGRR
jgi:hypothetical protein